MNSEAATSSNVSVIIPTFNRAEFLAQAVDSGLAGQEQVSVEVRPHRWDPEIKHPEDWYFFCMAVLAGGRIATRHDGTAYWLRGA